MKKFGIVITVCTIFFTFLLFISFRKIANKTGKKEALALLIASQCESFL